MPPPGASRREIAMPTVMPHSELLKRALGYVNDARQDDPGKPISIILDEAAMRFNLSPADGEVLQRLFKPESKPEE